MVDMDTIMFSHDGTNMSVSDRWSTSESTPAVDTSDDITLDASSTYTGGVYNIVFSRALSNSDA